MHKYILKRLAMMFVVLIGVTFVVYFIVDKTPGDPAAMILGNAATPESIALLHEEMGLDDPLIVRYFRYMAGVIQGDFGTSYKTKLEVGQQIAQKLPNTILLSFGGMVFAVVIGIPVGILCAKKQYSIFDNVAMFVTLLGTSAPAFWMGLVLIIVFSLILGWFPSASVARQFFCETRTEFLRKNSPVLRSKSETRSLASTAPKMEGAVHVKGRVLAWGGAAFAAPPLAFCPWGSSYPSVASPASSAASWAATGSVYSDQP